MGGGGLEGETVAFIRVEEFIRINTVISLVVKKINGVERTSLT